MTDLINKVDELIATEIDAVQAIVNMYTDVLQGTLPEKQIPYLGYLIDVCVKHIKENHNDLSVDWKAWAVLMVRNMYLDGIIKTEEEIGENIDNFIKFKDADYKKYCDDIIASTEYDRDRGFMHKYIKKKIGSY